MSAIQSRDGAFETALQPGWRAWLRRVLRIAALAIATLALVIAWFLALPFTAFWANARRKWRRIVFQAWARTTLRVCSIRMHVVGELSVKPCFLVANHTSYVDVLVLAATVDATFVSMKELERWPLFGLMARQFGTVFIDRAKKRDLPTVNREIERAFERSDAVVIFPEGTHTRGDRVLPFRPSLLEPATRAGRPVTWAVIHYETSPRDVPASRAIPWVGMAFSRQVMVLLALEGVEARVEFGTEVLRGGERKELARELHQRVNERFVPLK
jgi:1-acyl-sn-glycerol-3-phosphate acyltransferase